MSLISRPPGVLLVAAAILALAACGRRGELEAPDAAAVRTPPQGEPAVRKPNPKITPPKKDFALDPLLQ